MLFTFYHLMSSFYSTGKNHKSNVYKILLTHDILDEFTPIVCFRSLLFTAHFLDRTQNNFHFLTEAN